MRGRECEERKGKEWVKKGVIGGGRVGIRGELGYSWVRVVWEGGKKRGGTRVEPEGSRKVFGEKRGKELKKMGGERGRGRNGRGCPGADSGVLLGWRFGGRRERSEEGGRDE